MSNKFFTKDIFANAIENYGWAIGDYTYGRPAVSGKEAKLHIGKFCSIATGAKILVGHEHRTDWVTTYPFSVLFRHGWTNAQHIKGHPLYLKNYPTFDILGGIFDISASKAKQNITKLLPILRQAEKNLGVLPHRHFRPQPINEEENSQQIQEIIIDGTERRRQRPKHSRKQKNYYSGKKHTHTFKNTIISDSDQGISVVGPTSPGRRHDYSLLKKELDPQQTDLSSVEVSVDLGYKGIKDEYSNFHRINIPHKKPKKSKSSNPVLTPGQKKENRAISRKRIVVEHLIGDLKAFHILSNTFRNRATRMADQVISVVAGLANLKNNYAVQ